MRFIHLILIACCFGLCSAANAGGEEQPAAKPLTLGLMPYLTTRSLINLYQPLADRLEQDLHQPVRLETAPDFDTYIKRVVSGNYDLVLLAPHYARLAIRDYGYAPLLLHKAPIRGILVTARNQPLHSLADLRQQSIAVVERSAVMGIGGALLLAEAGLKEERDYRFVETVTHSSALHSAVTGKTRAAIVSYPTLLLASPELQGDAVVFRELAPIPGMFYLAHGRLPAARQAEIKAALRHFEATPEGQAFFEKTKHGGLRETNRDDAEQLDRMLPETRRLLGNVLP